MSSSDKTKKRRKLWWLVSMCCSLFLLNYFFASSAEIKNITAQSGIKSILLQWEAPSLQETEGILVVRQEDTCSENFNEKEIVYRGSGVEFTDNKAKKDTKYCYSVFLYNYLGTLSLLGQSGVVQLRTIGEYLGIIFEDNIFIGIGLVLIVILSFLNIRQRRIIKVQAR